MKARKTVCVYLPGGSSCSSCLCFWWNSLLACWRLTHTWNTRRDTGSEDRCSKGLVEHHQGRSPDRVNGSQWQKSLTAKDFQCMFDYVSLLESRWKCPKTYSTSTALVGSASTLVSCLSSLRPVLQYYSYFSLPGTSTPPPSVLPPSVAAAASYEPWNTYVQCEKCTGL